MGGVAFADTLQDTIDDSGVGVTLTAGSSSTGTASIRVVGNSAAGDPDPGCNIDAGENPLSLDIVTPTGVTANPDPLSITSCGTDFPVSFTASAAAVSGTATVTVLSGPAGGGTYVNQVQIPITVTKPAPVNTAPVVSVTGVAKGAEYKRSSVPTPGCSVVDAEDTDESATPQITGGAFNDLGAHTVTCSYTDKGATPLTGTATASYTVVRDLDTTAPSVAYTLNPDALSGDNGWYTGDVSLNWTVTEAEAPETLTMEGCGGRNITADQNATEYTCTATSEGGTVSESVTIKRDANGPVVSYDGVVSGTKGANDWYTSPVKVRFNAVDVLSGPGTATATATAVGDGSAVSVGSPAFTDGAGNTTSAGNATSPAFKIDTRAPNAPTASLSPAPNAAGWNNSNVVVTFTKTTDNGPSGVDTCTADQTVNLEAADQTVSGTCTDNAGNVSSATRITVNLDKTGPVVSNVVDVPAPDGDNGWYRSPVTATFTATDALSGPGTDSKQVTSTEEGDAVQVASPAFSDVSGNTTTAGAVTKSFKIDSRAPNAPTVSLNAVKNSAGWHNANVLVTFNASGDNGASGVAGCTSAVLVDAEAANQTVSGTCTDRAGNTSSTKTVTINLDKTGPVVSNAVTVDGTTGTGGWYTSDVKVTFSASDGLSGLDPEFQTVSSTGEGAAVAIASPVFTDNAGNSSALGVVTKSYKVDKSAPKAVKFSSTLAGSYYFGAAPAAPTCTATDDISGVASCVVTGGGTTVGDHTFTAKATDYAGHTTTVTHAYTVLPWSTKGYFAPVDMGGVWNAVKGGSTVPLKFELFTGTTELTSTTAVTSFVSRAVACPGSTATIDEIETVLTGATNLRYDITGGQFIQNWQTPKKPGTCAVATTTMADGSTISANFLFR